MTTTPQRYRFTGVIQAEPSKTRSGFMYLHMYLPNEVWEHNDYWPIADFEQCFEPIPDPDDTEEHQDSIE